MERWSAGAGDDGTAKTAVGDALGIEGFALNRYRLPSGAGLPSGLHAHLDQEEVFAVLDGELRFETVAGAVSVEAGEAVRFAPGEYQTGKNAGTVPAVVLAIGAPQGSDAVRVPLDCPTCGALGLEPTWDTGSEEAVLRCHDCSSEHRTAGCPACGREELRVAADEAGNPVVRCPDCGAERDRPIYR